MNQCPRCKEDVQRGQPSVQLMERKYHLPCIIEHLKGRRDEQSVSRPRGSEESDEGRTLDATDTRVN